MLVHRMVSFFPSIIFWIQISRGWGGTWPEKWLGCADRKWKNPLTHLYFFWNYTHIYRIFDIYFAYFSCFFAMIKRILGTLVTVIGFVTRYGYYWWIILNPGLQIVKYTHFYRFCPENKPTHTVRTSPYISWFLKYLYEIWVWVLL